MVERLLDEGGEEANAVQRVYLVTISRVIAARLEDGRPYKDLATMSREDVGLAIRDALDNPLPTGARGGRPRAAAVDGVDQASLVSFLVVFRERHADGSVHFHIVVKLAKNFRFGSAKHTLCIRHCLPSHWSCTHSQVWSAMRYLHIGTPTKPDVDESPWQWAADGRELDLFALSQQPFEANLWRKRREAADKSMEKMAKTPKRPKAFSKLDMAALVISKSLRTKDSLIAYVQQHGTVAMQAYANKYQRRLSMDIEDAIEWEAASSNAELERVSDWDMVRQYSTKECSHPAGACSYKAAVDEIFRRNSGSVDQRELAAALRDILVHGPTKTTRVPFLVGPTNSGKSTIVYPFDDLFTRPRVLHKPALGSTFGLRNLAGHNKRFIFWDDFRPVEFAHEKTVPVSLFLSLFIGQSTEIQVSQAFNDGNKDVVWKHGAVFTAKQDGLWEPTSRVPAEDVRHMRKRVREFVFTESLADSSLKEVTPCAACMARWIVDGAAAWDSATHMPELPLQSHSSASSGSSTRPSDVIAGCTGLLQALQAPDAVNAHILVGLEELGAVSVHELSVDDWAALGAWGVLKPLQRRRLLQHLGLPLPT